MIATNGDGLSLAGAGAGRAQTAPRRWGYALAQLARDVPIMTRGDLRSTGVAPFDTINAIVCQGGACVGAAPIRVATGWAPRATRRRKPQRRYDLNARCHQPFLGGSAGLSSSFGVVSISASVSDQDGWDGEIGRRLVARRGVDLVGRIEAAVAERGGRLADRQFGRDVLHRRAVLRRASRLRELPPRPAAAPATAAALAFFALAVRAFGV